MAKSSSVKKAGKKAAPKKAVKKAAPKKAVKKAAPKKATAKKTALVKTAAKKMAPKAAAAATPWAYYGTDDTPGVPLYAESPVNSWAAAVVWLTMTTNPDLLQNDLRGNPVAVNTADIAAALNVTENCVKAIRNQALKDKKTLAAFRTVAQSFVSIGLKADGGPGTYPPPQCLSVAPILNGMQWVKDAPLDPTAQPVGPVA